MPNAIDTSIDAFLAGETYAVVGASRHRHKYGNKVLRCYQQAGRNVYAVNPAATTVEGFQAYPSLSSLPEVIHGISIITPPRISESIVAEAMELGIRHLWFQPGAEHGPAIAAARTAGCDVIADGPCILVVLGFKAVS
jgi:predicted CoA-binding protein